MLVARAFVLGFNARAGLAVAIVAMSVAYAVLAGAAVGGLREASATLSPDLAPRLKVVASPGLAPFDAADAPPGSLVLTHAAWRGIALGTMRPWPHGEEARPGAYAHAPAEVLSALAMPDGGPAPDAPAPWDWVLVPPAVFDRLAPDMVGLATIAFAPVASAGGPPTPAAGAFYQAGAEQVKASVHLLVAAVALIVAVLAGGVLRLEVLARERDLATVEALGGGRAARQAVVLRAVWLVGLGCVLGVVGGLLFARLAGRAVGSGALRPDLGFTLEAALVAFAAGALSGALGGLLRLRTPIAPRLGRRGPSPRRFPGPVRFLAVTPRLTPSAVASALVLVTVSSVVLAAAAVPTTVFEPEDGTLVVGRSSGNPFRGSADRFWGEHATLVEGINASSPEVFAPTVLGGRPVLVRGVDFQGWRAVDGVTLAAGQWPAAGGDATAGAKLARATGLVPGDQVVVPGAYRATARNLVIVGIHEGGGLAEDELVTGLDTAADLAGLPPEQVHIVRVRATREALREALEGQPIVATDISVVPPRPIPNTEAEARVVLWNLSPSSAARTLTVRVNDIVAASTVATVPGHAREEARIPFQVSDEPYLVVRVNPSINVTTSASRLSVRAPETVSANTTFEVRVLDLQGDPVEGADVAAGASRARTNASGAAVLSAGPPGSLLVTASSGESVGGRTVYVVEAAWALTGHLVAEHAVVASVERTGAVLRYALEVTVANVGGAPFEGEAEVLAGGARVGAANASVGVRQRATLQVEATVPEGTPSVEVASLRVALPAPDAPGLPPEQRASTVAGVLAEKRAAAEKAQGARQVTGRAFLEDVFAALEPSVVIVVLATFLHAGAGVAVAVMREVRERAETLQVVAMLGASPDQLAMRAARDAVVATLPGLLLGGTLGVLGLVVMAPYGFPGAFGHTIPVAADAGLLLRAVGALAVVAAIAAARAALAPAPPALRRVAPVPLARALERAVR